MKISWYKVGLLVVLLALVWYGVFVLTGMLWWNAPRGKTVPPPPPMALHAPNTGWVDLGAYQNTHPEWRP